jgi:hypothetical protein
MFAESDNLQKIVARHYANIIAKCFGTGLNPARPIHYSGSISTVSNRFIDLSIVHRKNFFIKPFPISFRSELHQSEPENMR